MFHFTCGESNLHQNVANFRNFMISANRTRNFLLPFIFLIMIQDFEKGHISVSKSEIDQQRHRKLYMRKPNTKL